MSSAFGLPNISRSASQGGLSDLADKAHDRSPEPKLERQLEMDMPTQLRFPDNPESTISAKIRRVHSDFFKLFSKAKVPVSAKVQIVFRGEIINGDVAYCNPEEDGFSVGVNSLGVRAGRRELRYPVNFTGQLTMRDCSGPIKTRVVDMSSSGLGLMLPVAVEVGKFVAVEIERGTFFGEIRHCVPATGFFRAGIQVEEFMPAKVQRAHCS